MAITPEQQERIAADVERWPDPPDSAVNFVGLLFSNASTRDQQAA